MILNCQINCQNPEHIPAKTDDPRISIMPALKVFVSRNFWFEINNFKGFIDEKSISSKSAQKRLVHG